MKITALQAIGALLLLGCMLYAFFDFERADQWIGTWVFTVMVGAGLVFTGTSDGYVKAFDAKSGKELWRFQTGSGIVSVPITWEVDGEQYIGLSSGYGGAVPLWGGDMADLTKKVTQGGSFWAFKLPRQVASR